MANPSSFFKAIVPGTGQDNLKIPLAYGSQMEHLPKEVTLRDRYGNCWKVDVTKNGDQWLFDKGWPQLYRDTSATPGDLFVFERRHGVDLFDFRRFNLSGAEKRGVGASTSKPTNESNNEEDEDDEDEDEDDDDDDDSDESCVVVSDDTDDDCDESCDDVSDDKDSEIDEAKGGRRRKSSCVSASAGAKKAVGKQRRRRQTHMDYQGEEIFKSGLASRPKNAFFVSISRNETRPSELQIPRDVIRDYKLEIPKKLNVVDEEGNKWEALTRTWKDGRMALSKGWRSLCRVNRINWDDSCICEFVCVAGELELHIRRVWM